MDKITLNKEQLTELVGYIDKRGFHTPLVIVDILDHFACKVEEKLAVNPGLSLIEAMGAAHSDFGVMGFAPIASAYEANVRKVYAQKYGAERRHLLANPLYVVLALLTAFLCYWGYGSAERMSYKHLFGFNDVASVLYLTVAFFSIGCILKFRRGKEEDSVNRVLASQDVWIYIGASIITFGSDRHFSATGGTVMSVLTAFVGFFAVISFFTRYTVMKKAFKDTEMVYDYFNAIHV